MTTSHITTTRNETAGLLDGMTWEVDDLLVATITRGKKMNANGCTPWTVRLYTGPEEYDLYRSGNLIDAQNIAYQHAAFFAEPTPEEEQFQRDLKAIR